MARRRGLRKGVEPFQLLPMVRYPSRRRRLRGGGSDALLCAGGLMVVALVMAIAELVADSDHSSHVVAEL